MRTRDIRVGMAVEHAKSGKSLGRVVSFSDALVTLDGECPIATPAELRPRRTLRQVEVHPYGSGNAIYVDGRFVSDHYTHDSLAAAHANILAAEGWTHQ